MKPRQPAGYTRRPDGTMAKTITFDKPSNATETLVRTDMGAFRVERSRRALARRRHLP